MNGQKRKSGQKRNSGNKRDATNNTNPTAKTQRPKDTKIQRYKAANKTPKNLRKQFLIGVTRAQRTKNKRCAES